MDNRLRYLKYYPWPIVALILPMWIHDFTMNSILGGIVFGGIILGWAVAGVRGGLTGDNEKED